MASKKKTLYPAIEEDNDITDLDKITFTESSAPDTTAIDFTEGMEEVEETIAPDGKPFDWHGVEFPGWAQGPHFIRLHTQGTFCLAIDPACVTMEMKANWTRKYVPILVNLGQQVLEKLLKQPVGHS